MYRQLFTGTKRSIEKLYDHPRFEFVMATDAGFTGPVNLGNPDEITIRELAEIVIDLTGSSSKPELRPPAADDPMQRKPDISLAYGKLNWQPKVALRDGLRQTIEYFEALLSEAG